MAIRYNAITFNGKSSADFTFPIAVLSGTDFVMGNAKTQLIEINGRNGSAVRENRNRNDIAKQYKFLLKYPTKENVRDFKKWLAIDKGKLITFSEPDVFYNVKKVEVAISEKDDFESYEADVTFTCDPIAFMKDVPSQVFTRNGTLTLQGTAEAFPTITISGTANGSTHLTIGNNTVHFQNLNGTFVLDCSLDKKGFFDSNGRIVPQQWKGQFFHFDPLDKKVLGVALGPNIHEVIVEGHWGYV